jgi:ferric-dicitrate binding protein FerR (iron transport regulator)
LQSRYPQPTAASGLFLEEHLATCTNCRAEANLLDGLRELHAAAARPMHPSARERIITAALSTPLSAKLPPRTRVQPRLWAVPALAAVAALAFVALHARAPRGTGDRVLAGRLEIAGRPLAPGAALAPSADFSTATGGEVALAHASVELRAATRAVWDRSRHELQLDSGGVFVDVDETRHAPFSVRTARFRVEVLGTRFAVTAEAVRVFRGRVRVVDPAGVELARLDLTHPRWQLAAANEPSGAPAPQPAAAGAAALPERPAPPAAPGQPGRLLERARAELGAGGAVHARKLIAQALARPLSRELRGEALSLRAECALVEAHYAAARDAYLAVAHQLPDLPAGKTALFAAGRIEAQHGSSDRAARLFARYLAVDPRGPFANEARARLADSGTRGKPSAP